MQQRLACLFLVLSILHSACGLYFLMEETEHRCFIQTTPDDITVTVNYKAEEGDSSSNIFMPLSPGSGMHWVVRDFGKRLIFSRTCNSEGRFSFTTYRPGDHYICLQSNNSASFEGSQLRVHLDIRASERTVDYDNVTQKMELERMNLKIRQLQNQAEQIQREQNYQRFLEVQFRRTSDSIYSKVVWWSIAQGIILVFIFSHMIHNVNKLSFLYKAFCKVLCEENLARFKTAEAYNALMEIIGPQGQGVSNIAISQWISQIPNPESTDMSEQININAKLLSKVNEFVDKFINKQVPEPAGKPKENYYTSNVNLTNLLANTPKDRNDHLTGQSFLLVCECKDCKANDWKSNGESTKS